MNLLKTAFIDEEVMLVQGLQSMINAHRIPGFEFLGHYNSRESFFRTIKEQCNLIITEINLADNDLAGYVPKLKKHHPDCRVVILTNYDSYKLVRDMMKSGADGYILKKSSFGEFIHCIEEVLKGEAFIGNGLQLTPSKGAKQKSTPFSVNPPENIQKYEDRFHVRQKLTKREYEILQLITQAKTNKEIADMLFISDQTVGVHKKNIMRKLNVRSTLSLIKYAMEQNLV